MCTHKTYQNKTIFWEVRKDRAAVWVGHVWASSGCVNKGFIYTPLFLGPGFNGRFQLASLTGMLKVFFQNTPKTKCLFCAFSVIKQDRKTLANYQYMGCMGHTFS